MTSFNTPVATTLEILGKLLLASLFWWDAIFVIIPNFQDVGTYIGQSVLPFPKLMTFGATVLLIIAPILLFVRRLDVIGLTALSVFCIMTACLFHPYWTFPADDRAGEQIHFMKDIALAGAMIVIAGQKLRATV